MNNNYSYLFIIYRKDDICFRRKHPPGRPDAKPTFKVTNQEAKHFPSGNTVKAKNTITCDVRSTTKLGHRDVIEADEKCPKSKQNPGKESGMNNISARQSSEETKAQIGGCRERIPDREGLEYDMEQKKDLDHVQNLEKMDKHMQDKEQSHRRARAREINDRDKYRMFAEDKSKSQRDHEAHSRKPAEEIGSRERKDREHYLNKEHNKKCERREGQNRDRSRGRSPSRYHSNLPRSRSRNREVNSSHRENPRNYLKRRSRSRSGSPLNKKFNNNTR